jgi:hypothetical protein
MQIEEELKLKRLERAAAEAAATAEAGGAES